MRRMVTYKFGLSWVDLRACTGIMKVSSWAILNVGGGSNDATASESIRDN